MIRSFRIKPRLFLYIFGELLAPFTLSLFVLLLTLLMVQMFRFTDIILISGSDLQATLILLKSLLISTFPIILPLAFLAAILLGYGRMSQDSELVALSSLGYTKRQLIMPSFLLCLMSFFFSYFCVTSLGPKGIRTSKRVSSQIASETFAANLKPGVFLSVEGMTVYVESVDKKTQDFKNFFVLDQRKDQSAVVFSKLGKIVNEKNVGSFLRMEEGQIHYSPKETNHAVIDFEEYNFLTDASAEKKQSQPLKAMTNSEILVHPEYLKGNFNYRLELHKRWQLSMVCVVFLVLGIAFGFNVFQRVSRSESLGVCMFLAMAYWILYFVFESFATSAKIIPVIYIPNLLFLTIAIFWMAFRNDSFSDMFSRK